MGMFGGNVDINNIDGANVKAAGRDIIYNNSDANVFLMFCVTLVVLILPSWWIFRPTSTSSRVQTPQAGTSADNSQLVEAKQLVRERMEKLKENLYSDCRLARFFKLPKRTGIANEETLTNLQAIYNEVSQPKTKEHSIEIGDQLADLGAVSLFLRYLEILSEKCKNYPESGQFLVDKLWCDCGDFLYISFIRRYRVASALLVPVHGGKLSSVIASSHTGCNKCDLVHDPTRIFEASTFKPLHCIVGGLVISFVISHVISFAYK